MTKTEGYTTGWHTVPDNAAEGLVERADTLTLRRRGSKKARIYSKDPDAEFLLQWHGQLGEYLFAKAYDLKMQPLGDGRSGGDGGVDFMWEGWPVNVKAANAYHTLHWLGVTDPQPGRLYVFVACRHKVPAVQFLGWELGEVLLERPDQRIKGYTFPHASRPDQLRPMVELGCERIPAADLIGAESEVNAVSQLFFA